ncbi:MAG: 1-deoxy-D-xylulose-5-phosphate reductoisomerase [Ruminococcaceae bacterium]|nr:1-deoxy-D-xylulose-5-phosphate reductoisomerase [Oscillospiraceae bacterium]
MVNKNGIILLGSTGSVGTQTLDVAEKKGIRIAALAAHKSSKLIEEQARKFKPHAVAMADENAAKELRCSLADTDIKIYFGESGILEMISDSKSDCVLDAISGAAGLLPALRAIEEKKALALANKECLVMAGNILMDMAKKNGTEIYPVDSEHSAIWQCLRAGQKNEVKKLILTASGGPFFGLSREEVKNKSVADTLAHPTWNMGALVTVNSATLMNKGFEVIEAARLFSVSADNIEVIVHRESIIHSMVEYIDNSIIAQLSVPDMRMCINYALEYPCRTEGVSRELNLWELGKLTFAKPDTKAFPLLCAAFDVLKAGGAMPAVLNAANEIAVEAFLHEKINFGKIAETVLTVTDKLSSLSGVTTLDDILAADKETRVVAHDIIGRF